MPSPFPGMDPFLEAHWGDVHTRLATYISMELRPQLPAGLVARLEESIVLELVTDDFEDSKYERVYPDVGVYATDRADSRAGVGRTSSAVTEPMFVATKYVPRTQRSVNIHDKKNGMRVVTAIELISPANKVGAKNRTKYAQRQEKVLDADTSLVEIDLIRQGEHVLYCPPIGKKGHYAICVVRAWDPTRAEVYPARFDAPLPTIKIPLREDDPDATVELQKLIDRCYEDGDYYILDYAQPLKPAFTAAENRWLKAQLKKRK